MNFNFFYRKRIRQNLSNIDFEEDTDSDEDWDLRNELPLKSLTLIIAEEDISLSQIPGVESRIQQQQKEEGEKLVVFPFFLATNFTKFKIIWF
jgi:hypothetical protein